MHPALHLIAAVLGVLLLLATLPLVLELLTFSLAAALPGPRSTPTPADEPRRLAVIIPAHNEETHIHQCVLSVHKANDIYVIAHNCSDRTAERASKAGATVLTLNDAIGGKGVALDFGFQHAIAAGADILLVLDADSVAGPELIPAIHAAFAAGARAVQSRYLVANAAANRRTRLAALAFLGMNVLRPLGRHRLGLSCGIFGNGFALSAATLQQVPYVPNSLVEDLEYHLHLIQAGIRVHFLNHAAVYGEMPETATAASSQRARWEGGRILMRRQWAPKLAAKVLRGQPRMLEPLLDLLAFPLATEGLLLLVTMAIAVAAHLAWLTAYAATGLATLLLYVLVAAALGPESGATLAALAAAPAFLVWKLLMIPRTRRAARADAAWVRTQRKSEPDKPAQP